ncbi:MAG: hypothetical protein ACOCP2_00775 [Halohasta sp.]
MIGQLIESLRDPGYTGDRRCWPCTVVNAVLVGLAALVIGRRWRRLAGMLVLGIGGLLIALRGYVVPYTPRFAPRLVDRLPVDLGFDHAPPAEPSDSLVAPENPDQLVGVLIEAGVLTGEETLYLEDGFAAVWEREMAALRGETDHEVAAAAAAAVPYEADSTVSGERLLVAGDRDAGLDREPAASAAGALRMFLPVCPDCGGPVIESTIGNCCGGTKGVYDRPDREALVCGDCESVLYEFQPLDDASSGKT